MNLNKFLGLFILLNGFVLATFAQSDTLEAILEEEARRCFFEKTNQTPQNTFPFNQADLIIVTSFPTDYVLKRVFLKDLQKELDSLEASGISVRTSGSTRKISKKKSLRTIPIWVGNRVLPEIGTSKIPYDNIHEAIILNQPKIDSLFSILYYQKLKDESYALEGLCYDPHHSILFYKNSQIIAYIEICFGCLKYFIRFGNNPIRGLDKFCEQKWCMLQKLFYSIGIRQELALDKCK